MDGPAVGVIGFPESGDEASGLRVRMMCKAIQNIETHFVPANAGLCVLVTTKARQPFGPPIENVVIERKGKTGWHAAIRAA